MDLRRALDLGDTEVVSFVGAGGKKTAMGRLVTEGTDRSIAYTTTTNMPPPEGLALVLLSPDELGSLRRTRGGPLALARGSIDGPERVPVKLRGFDPRRIDELVDRSVFDWVLVKADGARGREFTAPAAHEPAIPSSSSLVVVVVSVAAVGQPIDSPAIHRPDRVAALLDVDQSATLTADLVATVLADEGGGCKGIPPSARAVLLVNKADTAEKRATAVNVVQAVTSRTDQFDAALVTSFERGVVEIAVDRSD